MCREVKDDVFTSVRKARISTSPITYELVPHMLKGVDVAERNTGIAGLDKQVNHDRSAQKLPALGVGGQPLKLLKVPGSDRDLIVGERENGVLPHLGAAGLHELNHDAGALRSGHRDHRDSAPACRADDVPEYVALVLSDCFCSIDNE
ncbi:MAG: hypothetical protein ACRDQI_05815 [Pseudonocardiaceae bacterium]